VYNVPEMHEKKLRQIETYETKKISNKLLFLHRILAAGKKLTEKRFVLRELLRSTINHSNPMDGKRER
jgi:hypothetical protein